jgi:hypothetical protein
MELHLLNCFEALVEEFGHRVLVELVLDACVVNVGLRLTVSRFLPAAANSLTSVDCDDIMVYDVRVNQRRQCDEFVGVSRQMRTLLASNCIENTGDLFGRRESKTINDRRLGVVLKIQNRSDGHGGWVD